jgi:hypothetical protein
VRLRGAWTTLVEAASKQRQEKRETGRKTERMQIFFFAAFDAGTGATPAAIGRPVDAHPPRPFGASSGTGFASEARTDPT